MEAPVINPKLKETLDRNRPILLKNIIFCEAFYEETAKQNVFPENVFKDIKGSAMKATLTGRALQEDFGRLKETAAPTAEEKVDKMLEMLSLRGQSSVLKFCDGLQMSGHSFLADIIRDELQENPTDMIDLLQMMKHLPNNRLGKHWKDFKEEELTEVSNYINEKVRENVVKQLWKRDSQDKAKAMDAKQKQMEDSWLYTEQIKAKEEEIRDLKANVKLARRELETKDDQIMQYSKIADRIQDSHQTEMEMQMKYNVANDKSVQRVNEQLTDVEKVVLEMKVMMKEYFSELDPNDHLQRRNSETFYKDRSITTADKAKDLLELILERISVLEKTEKKFRDLTSQKKQLLEELDAEEDEELLPAFHEYVKQQEDKFGEISRQRQRMADRIEELLEINDRTAKHLHNDMDQLNVDLASKDAQVKTLKDEMVRLRSIMVFQEKKKTENGKRPTTPRFKNFNENQQRPVTQGVTDKGQLPDVRLQNNERGDSHQGTPSPASVDRRMVAFPQSDGHPQRPGIKLTLSRPHTQSKAVRPAASYPDNQNTSHLPPLTAQNMLVRPQRAAPSIPLGRGGRAGADQFNFVTTSQPLGREKTLATEATSLNHVIRSTNKKTSQRDPMAASALQRRDSMTGYVSNGSTYKTSSYRYG